MYNEEEVRVSTLEYFKGDELATNVWVTKYALKNKEGEIQERTPDDMHRRLAKEFARMESKFNAGHQLDEEQIYEYFKDFKYIVPQGSPMMGIGNDYVNVSLSNCVVIKSPDDNISSIVDSGKELANLFKRRCGVGLDISNLRPDGTLVNNSAGTTTGAWSFADFYSYVCRMIGQNGRRGALMITMDIRHPDIEKFVTMKQDLTKVTGANISVKISDDFMEAVENNGTFNLQYPVGSKTPSVSRDVDARLLWDTLVASATKTAEPGLLMWGNIEKTLPAECYADVGFKTICTNPCAEIPLSAYDSCRLISINLKNLVEEPFTDKAHFDYEKFSEVTKAAMRLSDDLVALEIEKLDRIIDACDTPDEVELWTKLKSAAENGRRTGLGTHGLADALACLRMAYDSPEANEEVNKIYGLFKNEAYRESVILARERNSFPVFDSSKEKDNEFLKTLEPDIRALMHQYGRRNISILTNAPTGSVSILSQTSSGLEPVFRNSYIRRRKLDHSENTVEADFVDEVGDRWKEFEVFHHNVKEWMEINEWHTGEVSKELPDFFTESHQIDWMERIKIQSTIQQHIDHAISSTINLPKDTPTEVVSELYLEGWRQGLKGVTIYVDGSRSGVLITKPEVGEFPQHQAPKRPEILDCDIHHTTIQGEKWTILVGLLDGKPYEIMGGESNMIEIPKRYTEGKLTKHNFKTKINRYDLTFGFNGDTITVKDIVKAFDNPNNSAFTRMISLGLRHGSRVRFMVEQLQKDRDSDMFSFTRCIARILKNYIQNGEVPSDKVCGSCESDSLVYQDGCVTCVSCGYAKCG